MYLDSTFTVTGFRHYPNGTELVELEAFTGRRKCRMLQPDNHTFEEGETVRLQIENHSHDKYWILDKFHGRPYQD